MASVDGIRVYRGIYSGFALAMSEANEGLHFEELPSSDELAGRAFDVARRIIQDDSRATMPEAQQEFTAMLVSLALLEHRGDMEALAADAIRPNVEGLWSMVGGRWSAADNTTQ